MQTGIYRPGLAIYAIRWPSRDQISDEFLLLLSAETCHIGAHVSMPATAAANACSQEEEHPF